MPQIKRTEMRVIDDAFQSERGYVLNFSNATFSEWFEDELGIDIDDRRYEARGTSKMNRLRCLVETESAPVVARVLRKLWDYRMSMPGVSTGDIEISRAERNLFAIIHRLEGDAAAPATDSVIAFVPDETLEELVQAIRRDAEAGKPRAALDRLHTYCMKKFAHLLTLRGAPPDREKPLHSRAGEYVKLLSAERELRPVTKQIMKNAIGIFQAYNDTRNNASFAHDNQIVNADEARFIFETVVSMLRFIRAVEAGRFESGGSGVSEPAAAPGEFRL